MAKIITFSRVFPSYHPRKGEPTYFREKILHCLLKQEQIKLNSDYIKNIEFNAYALFSETKNHTIRAGKRWKAGEYLSPRVWSEKPYRSKMITIAPDIKIEKVWNIDIYETHEIYINGVFAASFGSENCSILAGNDGLEMKDLQNWFNKLPFSGQIICWNKEIKY